MLGPYIRTVAISTNVRLDYSVTPVLTVVTAEGCAKVKVGNEWKEAAPHVKASDIWKETVSYVNANGAWKEGL